MNDKMTKLEKITILTTPTSNELVLYFDNRSHHSMKIEIGMSRKQITDNLARLAINLMEYKRLDDVNITLSTPSYIENIFEEKFTELNKEKYQAHFFGNGFLPDQRQIELQERLKKYYDDTPDSMDNCDAYSHWVIFEKWYKSNGYTEEDLVYAKKMVVNHE